MSLSVDMYMLVGRNWLKNHYTKSFEQFNSCCGGCWCCVQMKAILGEFEKKGYDTFNCLLLNYLLLNTAGKFIIF